jgi:hypothetical protein
MALRVRRIPEAAVVREEEVRRGPGPWLRLPEPVSTGQAEPVVADRRFLSEKARILRLSESLRAV